MAFQSSSPCSQLWEGLWSSFRQMHLARPGSSYRNCVRYRGLFLPTQGRRYPLCSSANSLYNYLLSKPQHKLPENEAKQFFRTIAETQIELKYQNLKGELALERRDRLQLQSKLELITQFNGCLIEIADASLSVFAGHQQNCSYVLSMVSKLKEDFLHKNMQDGLIILESVQPLVKEIESFKGKVGSLQHYKKRLIGSLQNIHESSTNFQDGLDVIKQAAVNQATKFKSFIASLNASSQEFGTGGKTVMLGSKLMLRSFQIDEKFVPQSSRLTQILSSISHLFEQHIHLLETQKMQYQFVKNKKLITNQKQECEICQSYEKIVNDVFSIVRKGYKQIKSEFLKQIKGIEDINQISILI